MILHGKRGYLEGFMKFNVNEDCLLQYLKSPDELSCCTDMLKLSNQIMEKHFILENILTQKTSLLYNDYSL